MFASSKEHNGKDTVWLGWCHKVGPYKLLWEKGVGEGKRIWKIWPWISCDDIMLPEGDKGKSEGGETGELILRRVQLEYTEGNQGTGRCRSWEKVTAMP